MILTNTKNIINLVPPSTHSAVGLLPRKNTGHKTAPKKAVFLCKPFCAVFCRTYSMAVRIGQSFGWLVPVTSGKNPLRPATQLFLPIAWRLFHFYRITAMNNTPRAKSAQNSLLFSVFSYRQPIAQGISGALAVRLKRRYPACIVKFSGFEGGAV